ncbi:MAG: hypothetical protein ACYTJ0_21535 [Planctomycetota bacterium]|jgi:hypothetical protein
MIRLPAALLLGASMACLPQTTDRRDEAHAPSRVTRLADLALRPDTLGSPAVERFGIRMRARSGSGAGTMTVRSRLTLRTRREGNEVVFDDTWEIMGRTFDVSLHCRRDALLSLQRCDLSVQRGDDRQSAAMQVEGRKAIVTAGGRRFEMHYPAGTVTQGALLRLVPQLPREPGAAWTFPAYVESLDMQVRTPAGDDPYRIVCRGRERIKIDGTTLACTRFTVMTDREVDFFVDDASRLRRIVADDGDTWLVRIDEPATATAREPREVAP